MTSAKVLYLVFTRLVRQQLDLNVLLAILGNRGCELSEGFVPCLVRQQLDLNVLLAIQGNPGSDLGEGFVPCIHSSS